MASQAEPAEFSLREERLNRGLTIRGAAAEIGVSVAALQRAEQGTPVNPSNAKAIADYYGRQVTEIWPLVDRESAITTTVEAA